MHVGIVTTKALGLTETGQETVWLRTVLELCSRLQETTTFGVYCSEDETSVFSSWNAQAIEDIPSVGLQRWLGKGVPAWQKQLARDEVEVVLLPFAAPYAMPLPTVRYVLQLIDWEGQEPAKAQGKKSLHKFIPETHRVIVTSKYLQQRCLELFEVPLEKIRVATAGTDPKLEQEATSFVEGPYMVCYCDTGSCPALVELVPKIAERFKDTLRSIVIAGPGDENEPSHWGDNILRVEALPLVQRAGLYRGAACFFYPHRYDGACLPSVEAMRAGVPVLAPVSGASRELLGDAPLFYNPDSTDSLFQNLRRVFEELQTDRARRVELGRQLARAKSWEQCAWEVLSTFKVAHS